MNNKVIMRGAFYAAALSLSACTGGSDVLPSNNNALLSGDFQIHQIGDKAALAVIDTAHVDVTSDGAGTVAWSVVADSAGGAGASGTSSYVVALDGTLTVTDGSGSNYGVVSATGDTFVVSDAERSASAGIALAVGVKKSGGLTAADLSGNYQIHQAGESTAGAGLYTARVDISADGAGAGTWNIADHSAGAAGNNGIFTYSINATDGTFSVTTKDVTGVTTIGTDYGILSADGSMFVMTDTVPVASGVEDAELIMAVGVKKSSALTNAVLKGNYQINQVGDGGTGMYAARVNITADGAGAGTWSVAAQSAGGAGGSGTFTYAVAADGTFTITTAFGTDFGIVSADGSLFAITDTNPVAAAGPTVEDAEIAMAVGIRK